MNEILEAIYNKALTGTNNFKTAIGGRFYHLFAPQNPTFPFATYFIVSDTADNMMMEDYDIFYIQFNIYSKSTTSYEAGNIYSALTSLYDWCNLSATGYYFCEMRRTASNIDYIPEENVWVYTVEYRIMSKRI